MFVYTLDKCLGVLLLSNVVFLFLIIWSPFILFFIETAPIYIPNVKSEWNVNSAMLLYVVSQCSNLPFLMDVRWQLIVIVICVSFIIMISNTFLMCLVICLSSLEKCLFNSSFKTNFLKPTFGCLLLLSYMLSLHILETRPLLNIW